MDGRRSSGHVREEPDWQHVRAGIKDTFLARNAVKTFRDDYFFFFSSRRRHTRYARPPEPEGGSQWSPSANTRISRSPTQYTGNDTPRYDTSMASRSNAPPGRTAATAPTLMPHSAARSMAASASWTVLGKRPSR